MSARMGALALLALFAILALPTYALATFSIVARDPDTGEIGVAVQSHYFAVGPIVPWAEPGVGAVALSEAIGRLKTVPPDGNLARTARALGISLGD